MKSASISISQLLQLKAAQKNFILLISGTWQAKTDWSLISSVYQRIGSSAYVIFKLAIDINSEGEEYCIESLGLKALPSLALFSRGNLTRMLDLSNGLVADLSECRNAAYLLEEFMRYHSRNANITQQMMFSQSLGSMSNGTLGRLFLSGDRSSVGKSSMCLAVLVSLLKRGVPPSALAYIKPVTQCEAEQPVTQFCDRVGIANRGIGPIVFYKGFTRAYLNGETSSAEAMLEEAKAAVDEIGRGKQFVLVDGVGYPSVGSICNISNADVARKLDTPVLLVGKSGVGDAVDSYNLNSAYFELKGVHVLGGIFNKLPLDGYYSLDACRESVTSYFQQHKRAQMPYGFVPLIDIKPDAQCGVPSGGLAVSVDATASEAASVMDVDNPAEQAESGGIAFTDFENALSDVFMRHVDIDRLIHDVWIYEICKGIIPVGVTGSNHNIPIPTKASPGALAFAPASSPSARSAEATPPYAPASRLLHPVDTTGSADMALIRSGPDAVGAMTSANVGASVGANFVRAKRSRQEVEAEARKKGATGG